MGITSLNELQVSFAEGKSLSFLISFPNLRCTLHDKFSELNGKCHKSSKVKKKKRHNISPEKKSSKFQKSQKIDFSLMNKINKLFL
jgi:hypothetical protein